MNRLLYKINIFVLCILICMFVAGCGGQDSTLTLNSKPEENVTGDEQLTNRNNMDEDSSASANQDNIVADSSASIDQDTEMIYVYVTGQVKTPGVYRLNQDDRVYKAIEAAGGFTKKASKVSLNLADGLTDGEHIHVLSKTQYKEQYATQEKKASDIVSEGDDESGSASLVNINSAGKEALLTLPGIGEAKADAIIAYRENTGLFHTIEDIMNVPGIKEGAFTKIKDKITV